jgi:Ca2+-binding EF-hand superfamily protein
MPTYSLIASTSLVARMKTAFDRFSTAGFMNEDQFSDFCVEMGLGNRTLIKRLFLCMDDDNTGALESFEFVRGLRAMCDGTFKDKERLQFAFHLFDEDRGGLIELDEAVSFVRSFASAAHQLSDSWAGCFEDIFGPQSDTGKGPQNQPARAAFREIPDPSVLARVTEPVASYCEDFLCIANLSNDVAVRAFVTHVHVVRDTDKEPAGPAFSLTRRVLDGTGGVVWEVEGYRFTVRTVARS